VPVYYTLKPHVHKPNGARPGMVIYGHQKTIIASPDEELPERLSPPLQD
jgi:predicted ribosome quality control (RQC) complex YloA/Tae2 family protein